MATTRQRQAAKRNVKRAQSAARRKRTIANLPKRTRSGLGKQASKGHRRGDRAGRRLEDRNRQQLYEIAQREDISGALEDGQVGTDRRDPQVALNGPQVAEIKRITARSIRRCADGR